MARRKRIKEVSKIEKRKRIVTYVTVEREIVTLGPVPAAFAKVIRDLRHAAGMTQQDAADALQISRPSLANIEAGRQRVLLEAVWHFADVYGISATALFGRVAKAKAD